MDIGKEVKRVTVVPLRRPVRVEPTKEPDLPDLPLPVKAPEKVPA